jgi:hypothetical protein
LKKRWRSCSGARRTLEAVTASRLRHRAPALNPPAMGSRNEAARP